MSKLSVVTHELHTVADYCRYGATLFNQAELFYGHGNESAFHDAYILVMYALSLPNDVDDSIMSCRLIEEEKLNVLALFTRRIEEQIPVAYITNIAYFAQLPFYVDERVLIPRSPIGELIENQFFPYIAPNQTPKRILDLCTGSGCIAIACASYFEGVDIDAVDLSVDALNVAQMNIENHGLCEHVFPIQSDVFSGVDGQSYDLIVSNPPYVDQQDMDDLPQEYQHEPEMGLACGQDGLDIVRIILAQSAKYLNEGGLLFCEVGNSESHVKALYKTVPFTWLNFERGGHGVFMLTKAQLVEFSDVFNAALKTSD